MIDTATVSNAAAWFAQIAVVAVIAGILPWLFRLHAPDVRHAYWRAVLVICLALPWLQGRAARAVAAAPSNADEVMAATAPATAAAGLTAPTFDLLAFAVLILLAGAVVRLVWIAAGYVRLHRLLRSDGGAADDPELAELHDVIPTRADVRYVAGLDHPVTFGTIAPVVLLPLSLKGHSTAIRRAVLAHELLHVQRRDWAWLLVEEAIRAVFWFHPAIWWLVDRVQLSREEVVDELAVTVTGRRRAYVEALLAFADRVPLAPAPAFARHRHLFRRIVLISTEVAMSPKRIVCSCAVMALVVLSGAWYASSAFPLTAVASAQLPQSDAGPLERRANRVTPENPIPRRISQIEVPLSAEADEMGARGMLTLMITLDEQGRVAEVRPVGLSVRTENPALNASFDNARWQRVDESLREISGNTRVAQVIQSIVSGTVAAVRQWQYDPPFKGPLAFTVSVRFGAPPPPPPPPVPASSVRGRGVKPPPPPPPPPPKPAIRKDAQEQPTEVEPEPIRVGSTFAHPVKIKDVRPVYPTIAMAAKVQGTVIVEARIERDGSISDVRVLRSIPLLDQAAVDAVRQWRFTPTLLNGVPVPIITTLTVNFTLQE
jgi:TonB family protein